MRQLVSANELLAILNEEMSKYEECEGCDFDRPPMKLATQDEDGCNWSTTGLHIRCGGAPSEISLPCAKKIVADARRKYNLK
jgi:hypothetical protein